MEYKLTDKQKYYIDQLNHPSYNNPVNVENWLNKVPDTSILAAGAKGYYEAIVLMERCNTILYLSSVEDLLTACSIMNDNMTFYYREFCITLDTADNDNDKKRFTVEKISQSTGDYELLGFYLIDDLKPVFQVSNLKTAFETPYDQYREYNGLPFDFLGKVNTSLYDCIPEENNILYWIRLKNEMYIQVWPEEIFISIDVEKTIDGLHMKLIQKYINKKDISCIIKHIGQNEDGSFTLELDGGYSKKIEFIEDFLFEDGYVFSSIKDLCLHNVGPHQIEAVQNIKKCKLRGEKITIPNSLTATEIRDILGILAYFKPTYNEQEKTITCCEDTASFLGDLDFVGVYLDHDYYLWEQHKLCRIN